MCGLAGMLLASGTAEADRGVLRAMTDAIAHRGPDDDGFHHEPGLGLGFRRLAIIDVAGAPQPMTNEDDTVVLVFNGEIYNFAALRMELAALGHVFRNRGDTETIIHGWEQWGADVVTRLSGMFAFALWDRNRRILFLGRDRLGKKPLHYAETPRGDFVFGSELAALAAVPELRREIDPASVEDFFALGYVPDPGTIWRGIRRLPAAHTLLLQRDGVRGWRTAGPQRYWSAPTQVSPIEEADAVAQIVPRLAAATAARLVSEVPLGAFLSGGVDSSAVVAAAATARGSDPLDTFTIGFDGDADETPFARQVAERYGTRQHEERAGHTDAIDAARLQARVFGEPFGDPSAVPTHTVCALARRHATVALSGDGGDEVFAGYRRHRWHAMVEAARAYLPPGVRRHAIGTLAALYPKLDRAPRFLRAKHTLTELSLDSATGYARTVTALHADRRRSLFTRAFAGRLADHDPMARFSALMNDETMDPVLAAQRADLETWLSGRMLVKVDRASMANSLEVRCPFLDHDLVTWGMALPAALKRRGTEGKYVLKRALEAVLPREVLYRPKQGFAVSHAELFRREMARLRQRLLGPAMSDGGLFDRGAVTALLDEHASGARDHAQPIWLLLVFEGFLAGEARLAAPTPVAA